MKGMPGCGGGVGPVAMAAPGGEGVVVLCTQNKQTATITTTTPSQSPPHDSRGRHEDHLSSCDLTGVELEVLVPAAVGCEEGAELWAGLD